MDTIRVTFPLAIPKEVVKYNIEGSLKKGSVYTCKVKFEKRADGENYFLITASCPEAFYLIGISAGILIKLYA